MNVGRTVQVERTAQFVAPARARWQWLAGALVVALWLALWLVPWAAWLTGAPWLAVALGVAMWLAPGWGIARLVWQEPGAGFAHKLTLALAVSITLTGLLGLMARGLQGALPVVVGGFVVTGAVTLAAWALQPRTARSGSFQWNAAALLTFLPLAVALVLAALLTYGSKLYADDYTYNAYLLQFQKAPAYHLNDIFFNLGQPAATRFWIMFYPLVQALLAEITQIHFLELTLRYLSPLLAATGLLAVYALARVLGLSMRAAVFAAAAQLAAFMLLTHQKHLGLVFLDQLNEDKALAAFVLTPIFWRVVAQYLQAPGWRALTVAVIVGLGLAFTHPTIAGVACLILALYAAFEWLHARRFQPLVAVMGALAVVMALPLALRFVDNTYSRKLRFNLTEQQLRPDQEARLWTFAARQFYGIHPDLVLNLPFFVAALSGVLALSAFRRERIARFLVAALVVVLFAFLPLSGWVLGLAVTPAHLWRVLWLTPFGLCAAFLAATIWHWVAPRLSAPLRAPTALELGSAVLSLVLLGGALGYLLLQPRADLPAALAPDPKRQARYRDYIALSAELDKQLTSPVLAVGATQELNRILPSLSIYTKVVAFRDDINMRMIGNLDDADVQARQAAWRTMTSAHTPEDERLEMLSRYRVQYILAAANTSWLTALAANYPEKITLAASAGNLRLYKIN